MAGPFPGMDPSGSELPVSGKHGPPGLPNHMDSPHPQAGTRRGLGGRRFFEAGPSGSDSNLRKQRAVRESQAHLLELDLLRGGEHTVAAPRDGALALGGFAYLVSLGHAQERGSIFVWRIGLADPLPTLELPLTPDVSPFILDLQAVFDRCYDENRYARLLEHAYTQPVEPALTVEEAAWVRECLAHLPSAE